MESEAGAVPCCPALLPSCPALQCHNKQVNTHQIIVVFQRHRCIYQGAEREPTISPVLPLDLESWSALLSPGVLLPVVVLLRASLLSLAAALASLSETPCVCSEWPCRPSEPPSCFLGCPCCILEVPFWLLVPAEGGFSPEMDACFCWSTLLSLAGSAVAALPLMLFVALLYAVGVACTAAAVSVLAEGPGRLGRAAPSGLGLL